MHVLKMVDTQGKALGMLNWFAVHPTSMNNTNKLISGDNKGLAAQLFEAKMNGLHSMPGEIFRAEIWDYALFRMRFYAIRSKRRVTFLKKDIWKCKSVDKRSKKNYFEDQSSESDF